MRFIVALLAVLIADQSHAQYLTTPGGMTLYAYSKDHDGKPTCPDVYCANMWPPYLVDGPEHDDWTFVERESGAKQWVYKGRPVYTFSFDKKPGDAKGDDWNGGEWSAVRR